MNTTTICKPKLIYQPDAPECARYNVQLWYSHDGGKNFYYSGNGRFFEDFHEAEAWFERYNLIAAEDVHGKEANNQ